MEMALGSEEATMDLELKEEESEESLLSDFNYGLSRPKERLVAGLMFLRSYVPFGYGRFQPDPLHDICILQDRNIEELTSLAAKIDGGGKELIELVESQEL